MLDKDAQIGAASDRGVTAPFMASFHGHDDVVKVLLKRGAHKDVVAENISCLLAAIYGQHPQMVRTLAANGVDVNRTLFSGEGLPLRAAVLRGTKKFEDTALAREKVVSVVDALLESKAQIEGCYSDQSRVLMDAAEHNLPEVVDLLLKKKAKIDAECSRHRTALMRAAQNNCLEVAQLLVAANADLEMTEKRGVLMVFGINAWEQYTDCSCALRDAAAAGHAEMVKMLLDAKASIDKKGEDDTTSLHCAAHGGHLNAVKVLLEEKADVHVVNANGITALGFAVKEAHAYVMPYLIFYGAKTDSAAVSLKAMGHNAEIVDEKMAPVYVEKINNMLGIIEASLRIKNTPPEQVQD